MSCFYYLKERYKNKQQGKSAPAPTTLESKEDELAAAGAAAKKATKSYSSVVAASPRSIPDLYEERAHDLRVFELRELRSATHDFSRQLKIGEGGFGSVYKGFLKACNGGGAGKGDGGIVVAVKRLNPNGLQGHKQWLAEVQFLGVVEHPNLVKLVGYCANDGERGPQRLLVYEFMPNKTLDDHLFSKAYPPLPWITRLKIVLGAAEGLHYLHEGLEVQVIYRDFKASNVLLDEEFRPKLSDFGLAREGPSDGRTHVSTAVMGSYGYAAPDYVETGHLTTKSDVWSFGVVLLEILTGRRSVERNRPQNEQKLVEWVKLHPVESKWFSTIIDPRLDNKYSFRAAQEIAKLAGSCLAKHAKERPAMREVMGTLRQAGRYDELDGPPEQPVGSSPPPPPLQDERETVPESSRRRMLHLAKLEASVSAVSKRRFLLMKAADPIT